MSCLITFFRFTNDFRHDDSDNINAILTSEPFQRFDPLFLAMGFKNDADYIGSYPSGFLRNSEYGKLLHADVDDSYLYPCIQNDDICVNLMDYKYDPNEPKDQPAFKEILESIADNVLHGFVFLFPTVSDVLQCESFGNVNHMYIDTVVANLPFCLDWDSYDS